MKSKLKVYGIYLPVFLVILPAVVALETVARLNFLLPDGYYSSPLAANVAAWITVGASLFFLTYIFTARKDMRLIPDFSSPLNYGPSAIVSAALLFLAVHLFTTVDFGESASVNERLAIIPALLALAAISYFAASAISVKRRSVRRSDFGMLVLVFLCVYVAFIFFDGTAPVNSPTKIVNQFAYLSSALFFLYETRLSLGREKWRPYVSFAFIAALTCAYSSIPSLIVYFVNGTVCALSVYEIILTFSLFIFAVFKLFLVGELTEEKKSPLVEKLTEYASEREAELRPAEELPTAELGEDLAEDENQISIADIDLEAEIIDAPTVEEGFLLEQELPTALVEEPAETTEEVEDDLTNGQGSSDAVDEAEETTEEQDERDGETE